MKRKIVNLLFALVLVLGLSLMTATPAMATNYHLTAVAAADQVGTLTSGTAGSATFAITLTNASGGASGDTITLEAVRRCPAIRQI